MEKSKKVEVLGASKIINFPTNGQIIQMDAIKQSIRMPPDPSSRGNMIGSAMSFFMVCWPEILEENNLDEVSWIEKDYFDVHEFVAVYVREVEPWLASVFDKLDTANVKALDKKKTVEKAVAKKSK